jgi:hypothetical protein
MEGETAQPALKVCRHCSVASRTDAEECPACGRPYRRSMWWWAAIPIVVLAFGLGYGVTELIQDDDSPGAIPLETGRDLQIGISREEFDEQIGDTEPTLTRTRGSGEDEASCLFYPIEGQERAVWQFCFRDDTLVTSTQLGSVPPG